MTTPALRCGRPHLASRRAKAFWARVAPGRVDRRAVVARGRGRVVEDGLLDARARARADRGRELEAAAREAARDDDDVRRCAHW